MLTKKAQDSLKSLSMYAVKNAFFFTLNADPIGGTYHMSPIDLMHSFDEGILKMVLEVFFHVLGNQALADVDRFLRLLLKQKRQTLYKEYSFVEFSGGVTNLSYLKATEHLGVLFYLAILLRSGIGKRRFSERLEKKCSELHKAAGNSQDDFEDLASFTKYDSLENNVIDNWADLFEMMLCQNM